MGFLDMLGGGLLDLGSSFLKGRMARDNADHAFDQSMMASAIQWDREKDLFQHRYQYTADDMRKAGLNPILAASGGFSVGSTPSVAAPQASPGNIPSSDMGSTALNLAKTDTEKENKEKIVSETQVNLQKVKTEIQKAFLYRKQAGKASAEEQESFGRLNVLEQQLNEVFAKTSKLKQETLLSEQQLKNAKMLYGQLGLIQKRMKAEMAQLQNISDVYKTPYWGQLLSGLSELLGSIGSLLGPAAKAMTGGATIQNFYGR